ncbi:MAG: hypothetical protein ABUK19_08475, partial [Desulfobacteria bacterium]
MASAVAPGVRKSDIPVKSDLHGVAGAGWYTQRASAELFFMPVGLLVGGTHERGANGLSFGPASSDT